MLKTKLNLEAIIPVDAEPIIKDYYGGWIHRYRAVERIIKACKCSAADAQLFIKLGRSKYLVQLARFKKTQGYCVGGRTYRHTGKRSLWSNCANC